MSKNNFFYGWPYASDIPSYIKDFFSANSYIKKNKLLEYIKENDDVSKTDIILQSKKTDFISEELELIYDSPFIIAQSGLVYNGSSTSYNLSNSKSLYSILLYKTSITKYIANYLGLPFEANNINIPAGTMPAGITALNIQYKSSTGALRYARINWVCKTKTAFEYYSKYFMVPGAHILLQWGRGDGYKYIIRDNSIENLTNITDMSEKNDKITKVFEYAQRCRNYSKGKYDAMLGIIVNYEWQYDEENNVYNCTTEIASLGAMELYTKLGESKIVKENNINYNTIKSFFSDEFEKYYYSLPELFEIGVSDDSLGSSQYYYLPFYIVESILNDLLKKSSGLYRNTISFSNNICSNHPALKTIDISKCFVYNGSLGSTYGDIAEGKKAIARSNKNEHSSNNSKILEVFYNNFIDDSISCRDRRGGYIGNIYINVSEIKSAFTSSDNLLQALQKLCDIINYCFCNYINLKVSAREDKAQITIVDENSVISQIYEKEKNGSGLDILYFNNILTRVMQIDINGKLPSDIGIALFYEINKSPNAKVSVNYDYATKYLELESGVNNEGKKRVYDMFGYNIDFSNSISNNNFGESISTKDNEEENKIKKARDYIISTSFYDDVAYDNEVIFKQKIHSNSKNDDYNPYNNFFVIPIELNLETIGISGFLPGMLFTVDILPKNIINNSVFQIVNIEEEIANNFWKTKIVGKMRYYANAGSAKRIEYIPSNENIDNEINNSNQIAVKQELGNIIDKEQQGGQINNTDIGIGKDAKLINGKYYILDTHLTSVLLGNYNRQKKEEVIKKYIDIYENVFKKNKKYYTFDFLEISELNDIKKDEIIADIIYGAFLTSIAAQESSFIQYTKKTSDGCNPCLGDKKDVTYMDGTIEIKNGKTIKVIKTEKQYPHSFGLFQIQYKTYFDTVSNFINKNISDNKSQKLNQSLINRQNIEGDARFLQFLHKDGFKIIEKKSDLIREFLEIEDILRKPKPANKEEEKEWQYNLEYKYFAIQKRWYNTNKDKYGYLYNTQVATLYLKSFINIVRQRASGKNNGQKDMASEIKIPLIDNKSLLLDIYFLTKVYLYYRFIFAGIYIPNICKKINSYFKNKLLECNNNYMAAYIKIMGDKLWNCANKKDKIQQYSYLKNDFVDNMTIPELLKSQIKDSDNRRSIDLFNQSYLYSIKAIQNFINTLYILALYEGIKNKKDNKYYFVNKLKFNNPNNEKENRFFSDVINASYFNDSKAEIENIILNLK